MNRNFFSFTDVPVESLRLRFALLQSLNNTLENFFLPLVELRQTQTYRNSIAALLCEAKGEPKSQQGEQLTIPNYTIHITVLSSLLFGSNLTPAVELLSSAFYQNLCSPLKVFFVFFFLWSTGFIFYDTKVIVMNRVLNATVQRTADHAAPEITLDPLEIVGGIHLFHFIQIFVLRPRLLYND